MNSQSPIWAITSYYNPLRFKTRYANFLKFRKELNIPLITVELSLTGEFEINHTATDIFIGVRASSILWHKESLLNIALKHVPVGVKYVAWLDCDIIFTDKYWYQNACIELEKKPIAQLFSELVDVPPNCDNIDIYLTKNVNPSGYSIASLVKGEVLPDEAFTPSKSPSMRRSLFGLAWAARIELIREIGFYDVMIIGSGDRALACACYGRYQDAINVAHLSQIRSLHYLQWAVNVFKEVKGDVGYVHGVLLHLWHGHLQNRKYLERHKDFSHMDFNPYTDLFKNKYGCWEWAYEKKEIEYFLKDYFLNRMEDSI